MRQPTAIIILNWNGAADTIECLTSLYRMTSPFFVVLVDNGSTDDSLDTIKAYLRDKGVRHQCLEAGQELDAEPRQRECVLYATGQNLGFARGNNVGVRLLARHQPARYLLLNNDTIVEPDFLDRLHDFDEAHPEYAALTPLICYNQPREMVWNAGGRQLFGGRRYYYARKTVTSIREKEFIPVTFLTGCALYFGPSVLIDGVPLTERFFFGEEDFDFCLRMNKAGRRMACVLGSKIYHKVSASVQGGNNVGKLYINTLNRFIDLRLHYPLWRFVLWLVLYIPHLHVLMLSGGYGTTGSLTLPWRALARSFRQDSVTHADFIAAMRR